MAEPSDSLGLVTLFADYSIEALTGGHRCVGEQTRIAGELLGSTVCGMEPDSERLVYLFGEQGLREVEAYDLDDESDRLELVDRFLPSPPGLSGASAAIRTIAVTQILNDDPPATWQAVQRMREAGLDRDEVLAQLSMAITQSVVDALAEKPFDRDDLVAALDALPIPTIERAAEVLMAMVRAEPDASVTDYLDRSLAALGPTSTHRILEPMVEHLFDLLSDGPLHLLAGDVTVVFHDTVSTRTFTHHFNDAERELGVLTVAFDLAAFGRFATVRLADGTELDQFSVDRGHLAWRGPDGWLSGFEPGDLLVVTATFNSPVGNEPVEATISITAATDEPVMTDELVSLVRDTYDIEQHEHSLPVSAEDLTVSLCHHHPMLFTSPLPPLSEWVDAAGLDRNGSLVAHDDSVWRSELVHRRVGHVFDVVQDPKWREVLGRAVEVLPDPDASIDEIREVLAECADPEIIDVLVDVLIPEMLAPEDEFERSRVESPGHVVEFVSRATAVARRPREQATAEYLACVLHEHSGQPLIAVEHLARVINVLHHFGPAVERMGWYCFDRGDAQGAMRWWRELDQPHPAATTIAAFASPNAGRAKLGRNDPCWCGSGRKFKQCHQGASEAAALPDRIGWMCRKASMWIEHCTGEARALVSELAIAWVTGDPDADASEVMAYDDNEMHEKFGGAFADPILFDVALHEGGLFARFLRDRGDLLPDDERVLAASWLAVDRSVHEVVSVDHGASITLRNLATADVVEVRERSMSRSVSIGDRYCARVVPDGETHQIIGGAFLVRTGHEATVLDLCDEGDPFELCAWAGAQAQPPRIVHRPGMFDEMFDRDAIEAMFEELGDADETTVMARLNTEISRQAQARWLDDHIPALDGLTPRQAAADPSRREQLERLLAEFDHQDERLRQLPRDADGAMGGLISYDTAALRRELGLA